MKPLTRKKLLIVNLLLCGVFVYTCLLIKNDFFGYDFVPPFADWSDDGAGGRALSDYAGIVEGSLYGPPGRLTAVAPTEKSSKLTAPARPPKVNKAISLKGTIVPGYAIFEDKSKKKQELFRKGEEVFSIGLLVTVEKNRAQILKEGKLYTYNLNSSENKPHSATAARVATVPRGVEEEPTFILSTKEPEKTRWSFERSKVRSIVKDINTVLYDAKLTPNETEESESAPGYKVSEVTRSGIFHQGGMKDGDVILKVNGLDVTEKLNWGKLFAQLKSESRFNVDILRNGAPVRFQYRVQ